MGTWTKSALEELARSVMAMVMTLIRVHQLKDSIKIQPLKETPTQSKISDDYMTVESQAKY